MQGQGAQLVKKDITDAFRHILVAASDHWLSGFHCDGYYCIGRFLPFGLRTSPMIFDLFAKGLHWILIAVLGWAIVLDYLDAFLAVLHPSQNPEAFNNALDVITGRLELRVNKKKDVSGTTAEFIGIEFDTLAMQARLSEEKLHKAKEAVDLLLHQRSFRHKDLESLVGFLSFASKVVPPGRTFLRRLYDALASQAAYIRMDEKIRRDL